MPEEKGALKVEGSETLALRLLTAKGIGFRIEAKQDFESGGVDEAWLADFLEDVRTELDDAEISVSAHEVGRGGQGTLYIAVVLTVIAGTKVFDAVIKADQALPILKRWLGALRRISTRWGGVDWNLYAAKLACIEHVAENHGVDVEIHRGNVDGYRSVQLIHEKMDTDLTGPYFVTIRLPEQCKTLAYVVGADGEIRYVEENDS